MKHTWKRYFDADTIARLSHIGFKPSSLVEGNIVGNHPSPFHGFAIEFAGHREYVPGDDIKHIDWKAYYKTEKYLVKQYEQETNLIAHILVDVSESMKFEYKHGSKIDYAAFIATSLSQVITGQSDSVGVLFFDNEIRSSIRVTSSGQIMSEIASILTNTELKNPTALNDVLSITAEQIGKRHIVFIISDFFGDIETTMTGIRRLMDDKHEIVLIQIVDPLELDFNIPGRVHLIELEGAEKMDIRGSTVRESYSDLFHSFMNELQKRTTSLGIDHVVCNMQKPFGMHLAEYLSAREFKR